MTVEVSGIEDALVSLIVPHSHDSSGSQLTQFASHCRLLRLVWLAILPSLLIQLSGCASLSSDLEHS